MPSATAARLAELGIRLPPPHQPVASYLGAVVTGNQIWVSGQGPTEGQEVRYRGRVGEEISIEDGAAAARLTGLNLLSQANQVLAGDIDRLQRCLKLFGLVNAPAGFDAAHLVVNGASDLMAEVFGSPPAHARSAVGATSLPFGISVELDCIFEIA